VGCTPFVELVGDVPAKGPELLAVLHVRVEEREAEQQLAERLRLAGGLQRFVVQVVVEVLVREEKGGGGGTAITQTNARRREPPTVTYALIQPHSLPALPTTPSRTV
jgi:hypothetical protein